LLGIRDGLGCSPIAPCRGYITGSVDRTITKNNGRTQRRQGKLLKPFPNDKGYLRVHVGKQRYVHDLVLEAWVGPRPPGRVHGCHADDNKTNNRLINLSWETAVANERAKVQHGRHKNGLGQTTGGSNQRTDYHREYRRRNGERIRTRDRARDRYNRTHKQP
jgi:hypothetical protein